MLRRTFSIAILFQQLTLAACFVALLLALPTDMTMRHSLTFVGAYLGYWCVITSAGAILVMFLGNLFHNTRTWMLLGFVLSVVVATLLTGVRFYEHAMAT